MGFFDSVGSFFSGIGEMFTSGLSLVLDGISGIAKSIGEGIKGICESIGTEGMILIGSIALSLLIPGFGLPEILSIIQIVGQIAQMLNIGGKDSPEELGMKSEIADKKPDDFDTTEDYLKYLNTQVKLEPGALEKLSEEERAKYGLIGSALDIKAIHEKYHIELSPDFLRDVTIMKIPKEEVGAYVKEFEAKGLTKMQEMTDYLRGNAIDNDKDVIRTDILDTMKSLYPELSEEQLYDKLNEMESQLKNSDI